MRLMSNKRGSSPVEALERMSDLWKLFCVELMRRLEPWHREEQPFLTDRVCGIRDQLMDPALHGAGAGSAAVTALPLPLQRAEYRTWL